MPTSPLRTSFAAQLAQLELGHLRIERPAGTATEPPEAEAIDQTLAAVWSDLFALFPDTALEDDAEEIAWGLVNLFHRAAAKRSAQIGLEAFREAAALLYMNETGSSWRPAGGSRLNHSPSLTSAVISGRDYLRARAETRRRAAFPAGTPVVFAGGRLSFATDEEAKALATSVWDTLDKVRERVADPVLVHGGDGKGLDRLAASWAERRKVPQVAFALERRLGARAGFRRNEQMLSLKPRYLVAFAGNGVLERLVIQAKEQGVAVVDRRGPLGTNPKRAAREAAMA